MSQQVLTPRLLEGATYTTAQRRHLFDLGFLVSIMVMVLAFIPSPMAVPFVSDLGHPGMLVAIFLFGAWALSRTHPRFVTRGPQPMRWFMAFYLTAMLASYAAGLMRSMPPVEDNGAMRAIIAAIGFCGAVLAVADGVHRLERLEGIVRVMLLGGAVIAVIGILQSMLTFDVTTLIQIPGLVYHGNLNGLEARGADYFRVASTTGHYIEFSTVMAMLLPFAVHMGRFAPTRPMRQWSGIAGALMFVAVPLTVSRTGIVAVAIALIVMIPAWTWRIRFNIVVPCIGLMIGLIFATPGLLGTIAGLFSGWDDDASVQGRAEDWDLVMSKGWLEGHWIFGRGQGTFIPQLYTWLDNQWFQELMGGGIIGVAAMASIHFGAITLAAIAYRRASRPADRHLCACLISTQMIGIAVAFTFDSFGFRTYMLFFAVLTGAAAAMWRITAPPTPPASAAP